MGRGGVKGIPIDIPPRWSTARRQQEGAGPTTPLLESKAGRFLPSSHLPVSPPSQNPSILLCTPLFQLPFTFLFLLVLPPFTFINHSHTSSLCSSYFFLHPLSFFNLSLPPSSFLLPPSSLLLPSSFLLPPSSFLLPLYLFLIHEYCVKYFHLPSTMFLVIHHFSPTPFPFFCEASQLLQF